MDDPLENVQPYPVELWPETRPVVGRSSSGDLLYPYQVAVVLGRGKLAKIEVEEYQVKLLGEQLRKEGACRGLDIRAAKFVSRLSEFQTKDRMLQWIEEVLDGERAALKADRAKTARERRRGEGNSAWSRRGRITWRLTLCW
jgi:hypothetical protein